MGRITDVHVTGIIKRTGLVDVHSILVVIKNKLAAVVMTPTY
ncbi:hypothetical protein AD45_4081 [Escherichia coli 4-203-08_S4_C3]|nr:hypothetical protein AD45_4081 [Escherichia coli 4-203-08_S4_C3]KEL06392.1 hypothetical protein AD19_4216 [Escherichia coli 4-203-08_S4_C2]